MEKFEVMSAIELIRAKPAMFFEGGRPTAGALLAAVLRDLGDQAQFQASILRDGSFSIVSADVDWLVSKAAGFDQLFDRLVVPDSKRPNAHRAEVLLAATCEGVLAVGNGKTYANNLSVEQLPKVFRDLASKSVRALIWKFVD